MQAQQHRRHFFCVVTSYQICNVLFNGGALDKLILYDTPRTCTNLLSFGNSTVRDTLMLTKSGPRYSPVLAFATLWLDTVNLPCLPAPQLAYFGQPPPPAPDSFHLTAPFMTMSRSLSPATRRSRAIFQRCFL